MVYFLLRAALALASALCLVACAGVYEIDGRNVYIEHPPSHPPGNTKDVQIKASIACGKNNREPIFISENCHPGGKCVSYYRCR